MVRKSNRISSTSQQCKLSPSSSFRKTRRKNEPVDPSEDFSSSSIGISQYVTTPITTSSPFVTTDTTTTTASKSNGIPWNVFNTSFLTRKCLICILGTFVGIFYFMLSSAHFDSVTNFSTLSTLEKELSLPTQTGLRYSMFKEVAEANNFIQGIRILVYDNRTHQSTTTNSFRKYSLFSEVVAGGCFHLLKNVEGQLNLDLDKCWKGHRGQGGRDTWKCSGLADPLTFYLKFNSVVDSIFIAFIFIAGSLISETIAGGLLSSLTLVLNHPQLDKMEEMFPNGEEVGSYLATAQIILLPYLLFTKSHPSWTPVVKIGLIVGLLILTWPMEAQWVLISQLFVAVCMHFTNLISPFLMSLLIAGHIAGWEYGSLMWLEDSLVSWSFYAYLLLSSVLSIFLVAPILDKLFAEKLDKWMFLRAILLALAMYIQLSFVRNDLIPLVSTPAEDPRLSVHLCSNFNSNGSASMSQYGVFAQEINFEKAWMRALLEPRESGSGPLDRSPLQLSSYPNENDHISSASSSSGSSAFEEVSQEENEDQSGMVTSDSISQAEVIKANAIELQGDELFIKILRCAMSEWTFPIPKFIIENFLVVILTLLIFPMAHFYQQQIRKKERKYIKGILITEDENESPKGLCMTDGRVSIYLVSITATLLILTTCIHLKFKVVFLAAASITLSLLPNYKNFASTYKKVGLQYGKGVHWAIIMLLLSLMVITAKFRVDSVYQPPLQDKDSNSLTELIELTKWVNTNAIRKDIPPSFMGQSDISIRLFTSTKVAVLNLNEESAIRSLNSDESSRRDAEVIQTLSSLFSKKKTFTELHTEMVALNATYLVLSRDFCTQGTFPHFPLLTLEQEAEEVGIEGSYLPRHTKRHTKRSFNSFWDYYTHSSKNKTNCNMIEHWAKLDAEPSKMKGSLDTLCQKLIKSSLYELKPFTRPFQNRVYTTIQVDHTQMAKL